MKWNEEKMSGKINDDEKMKEKDINLEGVKFVMNMKRRKLFLYFSFFDVHDKFYYRKNFTIENRIGRC